MSIQHTPEPWVIDETDFDIVAITDNLNVYVNGSFDSISKPDLRRIVACVNACSGIPTQELEAQSGEFLTASQIVARRECWQVERERERLAAQVAELEANLAHADAACADYKAQVAELLAALIEHQELTRPIQRTIEAIAKAGDV